MIRAIVNADDLGLSPGVNAGIAEAHERGIVTSASLMVLQPAAEAAGAYAVAHPRLGVGLHVDLGEWVFRGGEWVALYDRVPGADAPAVEAEIRRQLERFRALVGRDPDHLDSHQHVHGREPARSILRRLGAELGVAVRHSGEVAYCGEFYGQSEEGVALPGLISVEALLGLLDGLAPGCTEIACHPALLSPGEDLGGSMYRHERGLEVRVLCDPRVGERAAARGIVLSTFADCRGARP